MEHDTQRLIAAFRWSVISPLFRPGLSRGERRALRREILQRTHDDPLRGPRKVGAGALRKWSTAYAQGGIQSLCPQRRSDLGSLKAFPEELLERAIQLRRESSRRTVKKLVEHLEAEFPEYLGKLARSSLDRHLRARGWTRSRLTATAGPFIPFQTAYRNALWIADVLHGPEVVMPDGELSRVKVFGIIEDWSRQCVGLRGYEDERLPALEDVLKRAILGYGICERLFVDNGLIFCSVHLDLICGSLKIEKVHSTPGYAPSRGKVERFFRRVREELFSEIEALVEPLTLEGFNRYLTAWVESRYSQTVHSRTRQAPQERWDSSDVPLRTVTATQLQQAFLLWDRRKVGATGEVKLEGNIYFADPGLAHQTIIVRYDPFDMRQVYRHRPDGLPLEPLTVQHLVVHQLRRSPKVQEKRASAAAQRFLNQLDQTYQDQLRREMRLIRFSDLPPEEEETP